MEIQPPTREAVLRELALVLSSPTFTRNERQSRFLRFVVDRQLDGRSSELKESVIAVEVFGRPADYDSKRTPSFAPRRSDCAPAWATTIPATDSKTR